MFTRLSDAKKAGVFSALVVIFALSAALVIRTLGLPSGLRSSALYMGVPAATVLLMLLVVTRDGYTKTGWATLGLHRLGLRAWGVAIVAPVLVGVVGTAVVWATPLASFAAPEDSLGTVVGFFVQLVLFTLTLSLGEELGWRGYLLPKLLPLGRTRALLVTGLVWAAWHLPLIFLTPLYHADGNRWLVVPLFVATIVAGSFVFGYLRLWTGSTWPAAIAHSAHNGAWGTLAAFTATTSPVVVNEYLVGDNGVLILLGTALVAWWLGRRLTRGGQLERGQAKQRRYWQMPAGEAAGERGAGAPARSSRLELPQPDERHPRRSSTGTPILPTIIGLIAALAGPFLVQFVLAPLILDSPVRSSSAVLLSQG